MHDFRYFVYGHIVSAHISAKRRNFCYSAGSFSHPFIDLPAISRQQNYSSNTTSPSPRPLYNFYSSPGGPLRD